MDNNYPILQRAAALLWARNPVPVCIFRGHLRRGRTSDFIESREYEKPLNVYGYSNSLFDEYVHQILPEANSQICWLPLFRRLWTA